MRKIIVLLIVFCSSSIMAQVKIYEEFEVDVKPQFKGDSFSYINFINNNFKWFNTTPETNVIVSFNVETTGVLTNIKIENSTGSLNEKEALRVMSISPKWTPAVLKGQAVPCRVIRTLNNPFLHNYSVDGEVQDKLVVEDVAMVQSESDENAIYNTDGVDIKPDFPEGEQKFFDYFAKNFVLTDENEQPNGKIVVSFIIEKDGTLSDIKVLSDVGYGSGREAIRVLKKCPKWISGKKDGKKVRVLYFLPININNTTTSLKK